MDKFRHLMIEGPDRADPYTYPGNPGSKEFSRPPRDRVPHAERLRQQLEVAAAQAAEFVRSRGGRVELAGMPLEFQNIARGVVITLVLVLANAPENIRRTARRRIPMPRPRRQAASGEKGAP